MTTTAKGAMVCILEGEWLVYHSPSSCIYCRMTWWGMAPLFPPCPISWPGMPTPASLGPITAGAHICPTPIPAPLVSPLFLYLQFGLESPEDRSSSSLDAPTVPGMVGTWSQICPQVTPMRGANVGHRAICSLGLLGGGLAPGAD